MRDLRIIYSKTGRLKYISHLDVVRLMQRALARTRLSVWYTQGFNPHLYMTFALPLSLGFTSGYEILDVRLLGDESNEEVLCRLREQLPQGLTPLSAATPILKTTAIALCDYDITLECEDSAVALRELLYLLAQERLEVQKNSKRGIKTVDIRPLIELLSSSAAQGCLSFSLRCAGGQERGVNPMLVVLALCERLALSDCFASYHRTAVRDAEGGLFL